MNSESNKSLTIIQDMSKRQYEIKMSQLTLPEVIHMCLSAIESACNTSLQSAPEDLRPTLKQDMFDMINAGASTLLDRAFPEISLRPDLTEEAILEAENNIIQNKPDKAAKIAEAYASSPEATRDLAERKVHQAYVNELNTKKKVIEKITQGHKQKQDTPKKK